VNTAETFPLGRVFIAVLQRATIPLKLSTHTNAMHLC
jgi:hypothetical protein